MPILKDLAKMIDHSLLHPTMTDADILKGCDSARTYNGATASEAILEEAKKRGYA